MGNPPSGVRMGEGWGSTPHRRFEKIKTSLFQNDPHFFIQNLPKLLSRFSGPSKLLVNLEKRSL